MEEDDDANVWNAFAVIMDIDQGVLTGRFKSHFISNGSI